MSSGPPRPPARCRPALIGGLAVVAAAGVAGVVWWSAGRAGADRDEGLARARAGDFAAAEPLLASAHSRSPADAEVVEALAVGYAAGDDPKAEVLLGRWVELAPGRPEPLRARAAYFHRHKDGRAYADARALADLDPSDPQARRTAMNHAFSYGYFAEAEALAREGLRTAPGDTHLRTILAEARRAQGDLAAAAALFDALVRDHPRLAGPLMARAALYAAAGEPDKAVPLLRTAFESDPRQRRAAGYRLAAALEQTGQPAEAAVVRAEVQRLQDVEVYTEAAKTQPENLGLHVRLAEQLLAAGHTADGLGMLRGVLARDPRFGPAHQALADHYVKAGDAARAGDHRRLAGP